MFFSSQRPAERQIGPEDEEDRKDTAPQKRSVSGFVFRPSPLQKATQGFALKQATLEPAPSKLGEYCTVSSFCIVQWCKADLNFMGVNASISGGIKMVGIYGAESTVFLRII